MRDVKKMQKDIEIIAHYEGMTIEEAKLSFVARQPLPRTAFCGPNKTFQASDSEHVKNAFSLLSQFGHRLPDEVRKQIYKRLVSKAKKYGIIHDPAKYKWGKYVSETAYEDRMKPILKWYFEEILWIQKMKLKKGALRSQLGIKEGEKIPVSVLNAIKNTETGKTITFKGKKIRVTTQLKRRAITALRLRKMPKRGRK